MRKVVASDLVLPDCVTESPENWHLSHVSDEMREVIGAAMADAMTFGWTTYEEFAAFGPNKGGDDQEFADCMNKTPNFVDSTTLEEPLEVNCSTLIEGSVAEEITKPKQPGKDIST